MNQIRVNLDELNLTMLSKIYMEKQQLHESIISDLLFRLKEILALEPNVYYLQSPIIIVGDIHGQLFDLFHIFSKSNDDFLNATSEPTKLNNSYLFLGDYVDYGYYSIQTFVFLALLKIKFPQQIYLLRGKDEIENVNSMYGLSEDCMKLYGHYGLWLLFNEAFNFLPIAAVIDKKIFCVHSGISPRINFIGQISSYYRANVDYGSPIYDLFWSVPDNFTSDFIKDTRSPGYFFGKNATLSFLYNNGLIKRSCNYMQDVRKDPRHGFIVRSHQFTDNGFEWLHGFNVVTIWSAPDYRFAKNEGAFMKITSSEGPNIIKFKEDENTCIKPDEDLIEYYP